MDDPQHRRKHREIVEEHRFTEELAKLIGNARRADEFVDGAVWVLSRDPKSGTPIGKGPVHFLPVGGSAIIDPVVLYYTFDDERVYFLSIRKTVFPPKDTD